MRIGRRTIIPALLVLGTAASLLAGPAVSTASAQASSHLAAHSATTDVYYHG